MEENILNIGIEKIKKKILILQKQKKINKLKNRNIYILIIILLLFSLILLYRLSPIQSNIKNTNFKILKNNSYKLIIHRNKSCINEFEAILPKIKTKDDSIPDFKEIFNSRE